MSVLAPNWYALQNATAGIRGGAPDPQVVDLSRRLGFSIWPVVNATVGSSPIIDTPENRGKVISSIAGLAATYRLAGITLDMESMQPEDRPAFTALVRGLARTLHRAKRRLAVYALRRTREDVRVSPTRTTGQRSRALRTSCSPPATTSMARAPGPGPRPRAAAFARSPTTRRTSRAARWRRPWAPSATAGRRAAVGPSLCPPAWPRRAGPGRRRSATSTAATWRDPGRSDLLRVGRGPVGARAHGQGRALSLDRALLPRPRAGPLLGPLAGRPGRALARAAR